MLVYMGFAFTVLFPVYFVYRTWRSHFDTIAAWGLNVANGLGILVLLVIAGQGAVAGGVLRYVLYMLYAVALLGSWVRVSDAPFLIEGRMGVSWSDVSDTVVLLLFLGWALLGYWPDRTPADLTFPLRGEDYHVMHGGGTYPLNYHGLVASSQRYALDITQLNDWGFRAAGLYPERLSEYEIYGDSVYSPLTGTVVDTVAHLPDLRPSQRQPEHPAGNHVWIRQDSLYVVLAHLQEGSVQVPPGERVQRGERLAAVGNTGNTSEPHLHIHAVTLPDDASPDPDSLLGKGTPVPLQFNDRFLTRNDQFTQRRLPNPSLGEHAAVPDARGE